MDGANRLHSFGHVIQEILDLCHIQGELVAHNVLVRGGMTVGEIFLNDGTVFGPAMVRAYELESKAAIYPRVVIDPAVLNQVREDPLLRRHGYGGDEEIADIRKMIERGENGFWYVDYLRTMLGELDDPDHWPEVLKLHKQMIIRRYADKESRTASLDKLLWLAIYQNKLVSKITKSNFEEFGLRRGDFEVRTSELSELARMPKRARAKK